MEESAVGRFAAVRWLDANRDESGAVSEDDATRLLPVHVIDVGWVVVDNSDRVTLGMAYVPEAHTYRWVLTIPRVLIKKMIVIDTPPV